MTMQPGISLSIQRSENGLGSLQKDSMKMNADGSVDLFVGPKAPKGFESNWLPTMGKKPYLWFRFYAQARHSGTSHLSCLISNW